MEREKRRGGEGEEKRFVEENFVLKFGSKGKDERIKWVITPVETNQESGRWKNSLLASPKKRWRERKRRGKESRRREREREEVVEERKLVFGDFNILLLLLFVIYFFCN